MCDFSSRIGLVEVKKEVENEDCCHLQEYQTLVKEEIPPESVSLAQLEPKLENVDCKDFIVVENFPLPPQEVGNQANSKDFIKLENITFSPKLRESLVESKDIIKKGLTEEWRKEDITNKSLLTEYNCRHCVFNTSSLPELFSHAKKCFSKEKNVCPLCTAKASSKDKLISHLTSHFCHKDDKSTFNCDLCTYKTFNRYRINFHFKTIHMLCKELHGCKICKKKFDSRNGKLIHLKTCHNVSFKCKICKKSLVNKKNLERHVKNVHGLDQSQLETLSRVERKNLNLSRPRVESVKVFMCPEYPHVANFKYYAAKQLKSHVKSNKVEPIFECDTCGKLVKMKGDLRKHIEAVHLERAHKCDSCDYETARKCRLKTHKQTYHQRSSKSHRKDVNQYFHKKRELVPYICDSCDFKTIVKKQLKKHINVFHLESNASSHQLNNRNNFYTNVLICDSTETVEPIFNDFSLSNEDVSFYCSKCSFTTSCLRALKQHLKYSHQD